MRLYKILIEFVFLGLREVARLVLAVGLILIFSKIVAVVTVDKNWLVWTGLIVEFSIDIDAPA